MKSKLKNNFGAVTFLLALVVFSFWKSFNPDLALFATDDSLGLIDCWHRNLPGAWLASWQPDNLVGFGSQALFQSTAILLWLLPPPVFNNWIYAIDTVGAGFFFFLFLRQKECSSLASLFGSVVYAYCGTNFSLVHGGHLNKFGCYFYFAATLWALELAFKNPKAWSWKLATGAFLGLTVAEQPDVALFFVWLFVAYLAFRVFTQPGQTKEQSVGRFVGMLALCGTISGLVAANVVISQYRSQVQGIVQVSGENKEDSWNWATQWSYPPEEVLEMIAPGFFGWRIDEPNGTYWGRLGRSAEYETTKQGFARFKLDNSFIGIVPVFLALAMTLFAFLKRYRENLPAPLRRELVFWSAVGVVTLLLAFGRYFLLYHFFYAIPKMNIVRNPVKFLHLFSVAVAFLSAFGVHHLVERRTEALDTRHFWKILAGLGGLALVGAIYIGGSNESIVARFHEEFQTASAGIVSNMANALLRLAVSCGIFAVFWFWLNRLSGSLPRLRMAIPYLVLLLAATDLYLTHRHYIEYSEYKPLYAENDLVRFLKTDPEPQRSQLLTRGSFYNLWLTIYFPYYQIETLDVTAMPRTPEDYQQYLSILQPNTLRFWQLTNCKYLLGPASSWQQVQSDPLLRPYFDLAFAYNVALSNNVVVTMPFVGNQATQATQVVIRYKRALPRVKWYDHWQVIPDDKSCLRTLNSKDFDPAAEVIVSDAIDVSTNTPSTSAPTHVEWLQHTDNVAKIRVTSDRRGILLFNEKYDPAFVVTVDNKPAQLLRCNYIMKGVTVEAGTHEVRFEYRPPRIGFYVSVAAWVGCLITIPGLRLVERKAEQKRERGAKGRRN